MERQAKAQECERGAVWRCAVWRCACVEEGCECSQFPKRMNVHLGDGSAGVASLIPVES